MQSIKTYQTEFINHLEAYTAFKEPNNLYDPIKYILELGGKRLRPVLTLMTCEVFDVPYKKAMDAALAVEMFHNFSLVHDDIMDNAPLRRGKETVHEKWDINTGILSGDTMLILAYQLFENYDSNTFKDLARLFSQTAVEVCEGQQYDMDFELIDNVAVELYLKMIEYKTAVLLAAAMKMGAIVAGASIEHQEAIYNFGHCLGLAFQLQDDYLDAFGNTETFGKQVGGDIIENKKTYLYIKALEFSSEENKTHLQHLFSLTSQNNDEKINIVKHIFEESGAAETTQKEIKKYTNKAFSVLETMSISDHKKAILKDFGNMLMKREV